MRLSIATLLFAAACLGQDVSEAEQSDLRLALAEAGNSPVEFIAGVERHLKKYPESARLAELDRSLVKASLEIRDRRRIILYGERVLARQQDDLETLERVAFALLETEDKDSAVRALKYAQRFLEVVKGMEGQQPSSPRDLARFRDDLDRASGKALALQARATSNLGRAEEAVALARKSYDTYPNAEAAREVARGLARLGRDEEAVRRVADAFTIADPQTTDLERAADRRWMGDLYRKGKNSETGLGDLILEAYDRTSSLLARRRAERRKLDPNSGVTNPLEYTLAGVNGDKLALSSLLGKVVVLDFWATWCGPCRAQYPLYEEVKQRFSGRPEVVFLAISTDENRSLVRPFLAETRWNKTVYFEDGLSNALRVGQIPTTIIFNKRGELVSRMNGFIPERFVDMLSERIRQALE